MKKMDIVDINKVLDDLELNEEQHSKLNKSSTNNDNSTGKQQQQQPDLYSSYKYGQTTSGPPPSVVATTTSSTMAAAPPRITKTNFVKVSNVFNSLSEYMNAGIEAVKIVEENGPHNMNLSSSKETFVTPNSSKFIKNVNNESSGNHSYFDESTVLNSRGFEPDFSTPNFENPAYPNNVTTSAAYEPEMNAPILPVLKQSNQFVPASVSDQIIPTSLYEGSKNIQNLTTSSNHNNDDDDDDDDDDSNDDEENEDDDSMSSESDDSNSDVYDEKTSVEIDDGNTVDTAADSMEIRTELSSVVPPTSISLEITPSHETDTALPDAHDESSELLANELQSNDNAAMPEVDQCAAEQVKNATVFDNKNQTLEKNNRPETVSLSDDRFIKPITFETAATMDDVSDTELESYLQELEDLEDPNPILIKSKNDTVKSAINSLKSDDIEPYANDVGYDGEQMIENIADINQAHEIINQIATKDDRNADSFSQASTVEFGEVNATTSSNEQIPNVIHSDQPIESGQSINSVLNVEPINDLEIDMQTNPPNENDNELNVNCKEHEFSSDLENHTECSECELDQQAAGIAKRPNSLNLQNCNSTLIEQSQRQQPQDPSGSAMNYTNDGNAGSTPAAFGQFLSSSISSDDSNIINDNNQMILENSQSNMDSESANESNVSENYAEQSISSNLTNVANISMNQIGKMAPYWVPDNMTVFCMQCNQKFSFIKRRHHCRACGLVLCSACCSLKAKLEYLGDVEARICIQCDILLNQNRDPNRNLGDPQSAGVDSAAMVNSPYGDMPSPMARSPNPNNPMEYCSVIPPHQQVNQGSAAAPISVMVPVGVLKREGVPSKSQRKEKNVMFSDGIRPGCDLTDLDNSWDTRPNGRNGELSSPSLPEMKQTSKSKTNTNLKLPSIDPKTNSYIPPSIPANGGASDNKLPPICVSTRTEFKYADVTNNEQLIERLQNQQLKFMLQRNFYVLVKIVKLTCCINKAVINFTTQGMHLVGQDEIVILLELDTSNELPKDIFIHLNEIYRDADKGQAVTDLSFSMASTTPFLGSKEHGGFLFIRTTFQCMQNIIIPENPYLIGILIHRWEVPWAKIFPLRLMLRLGALHRYYPSPHVSVRGRNSVYAEIAQTIINFLADFRTYSYTIPTIRGMYIHMEDRRTNVLIPRNRYDQVMKALNNSSDHIFALAANFSELADGHLVCVQNTESGCAETHAYSTQAINIQGKPRKVTGASFLVLNGALKTTSGLSGKCSIVEDGLMVQILPKKMAAIQQALKTMKDIDIVCGPIDGDESQTELVCIQWVDNDTDFNVGVISPIDKKPMDGIPSIRVHHGLDFANSNHIIRWTEVFILKSDDESAHGRDPIDMSKLSEQIARSASMALVSFLDLLATNGMTKLAIRATFDQDQVCYEAGSHYDKLAPLYMNALDNELIPTLHRQATNLQLDQTISLELIFHIMDV